MKKLKVIAVYLVLAWMIVNIVLAIPYYQLIFKKRMAWESGVYEIVGISQTLLWWIFDLLLIVMGILFLTNANTVVKDRSYVIFRFVFLMSGILSLPNAIISYISYSEYMFRDLAAGIVIIFKNLVWLTIIIILMICKPDKPVPKVDLQQYDMVAFTSTGHRFLHYMLDVFFLLPTWLTWWQFQPLIRSPLLMQLLCAVTYLFYCFMSEAFFGQTLGKLITGSCVAGNGVELTAGRIFIRTLCRLIPFNAISFLFGGKWHDKASSTEVVYVNTWEKAFDEKPAG